MKKAFMPVACLISIAVAQNLPAVDLGYKTHRAFEYDEVYDTYNFSNIRYASPPIGELRFSPPVPPTGRNDVEQDGAVGRICPQVRPEWLLTAGAYSTALATNQTFNYTQAVERTKQQVAAGAIDYHDGRISEDCLFLDVVVPKAVFDDRNQAENHTGTGAPVLLWIHGGGYTLGSKNEYGRPGGLINASRTDGSNGIIFVAINYRLGAFGWLAGPTVQSSAAVSNAGLLDQQLAIEWVAKYIQLFGGNPQDITLIGESAGGGSILHQVTSYRGKSTVKFQGAILQSPGFFPAASQVEQEKVTQSFLEYANASSIDELRNMSTQALMAANQAQIRASIYGQFTYTPVVDGTFVPDLPGVLLLSDLFHKNVTFLNGQNANEGTIFTPPNLYTEADVSAWLLELLPTAQETVRSFVLNNLYPALYDPTQSGLPYTSVFGRASFIVSELIFTCNTYYLNRAKDFQNTFAYRFSIPPAFHGQDVQYTFATGRATNRTASYYKPTADTLQAYITNFAKTFNPNGPQVDAFPVQSLNFSLNDLTPNGVVITPDPTVNSRCTWWQQALYK